MKKLSKLQINSEKLMKNKELMTLRGGYGYVSCRIGVELCGGGRVGDCSMGAEACDIVCPDWDNYICAG